VSKRASRSASSADRNSVDVKALKTYQQIFIYITPIITNLGFVNIIVVIVRLQWFSKRFKDLATRKLKSHRETQKQAVSRYADTRDMEGGLTGETVMPRSDLPDLSDNKRPGVASDAHGDRVPQISFAPDPRPEGPKKGIYIPGPREREG